MLRSAESAALASTSIPIDRDSVARKLAFDSVAANSLDVVGDRDFVLEFVFDAALIALRLGGWAEEWILWSTTEFNFLDLPEAFCTGSSIMPHKKNPDDSSKSDPRQNGPRRPAEFATSRDARQGLASRLQSRLAGGQGTPVRRVRYWSNCVSAEQQHRPGPCYAALRPEAIAARTPKTAISRCDDFDGIFWSCKACPLPLGSRGGR